MPDTVRMAFEQEIRLIPLQRLLPLRKISDGIKKSQRYKRIQSSIVEIGLVEPLVVSRSEENSEEYLLLDGHLRYDVLIGMGETEARCIISSDDEAFTYNKRVNRLATVQEHFMILRAIENGVSEEKLARALNLKPKYLRHRKMLLQGIADEVVYALKDKELNPMVFHHFKKMKPLRQIEVVELMIAAGNFTETYAKALLAATPQKELVKPDRPKKIKGMTPEQMARMEKELETLSRDLKQIEENYGQDVLNLVVARSYLTKLVGNHAVGAYLGEYYPEVLEEFHKIIKATALDASAG